MLLFMPIQNDSGTKIRVPLSQICPVRGGFVVKRPSVCERAHDNDGATHIDRVRRG